MAMQEFLVLPVAGSTPLPWILAVVSMVLAVSAQARVQAALRRFGAVRSRAGVSGADVARSILEARGAGDVVVEPAKGFLGDHYDPVTRTLRLSRPHFEGSSVAALGVAAHEVGHALQHADGYRWLRFRTSLVPVMGLGSRLAGPLFMLGIFLLVVTRSGGLAVPVLMAAAYALSAVVLFSLVTLPVEIDASRRALRILREGGILVGEELDGARTVLRAAAYTYVAAAAMAVTQLVHVLAVLGSARRSQ